MKRVVGEGEKVKEEEKRGSRKGGELILVVLITRSPRQGVKATHGQLWWVLT